MTSPPILDELTPIVLHFLQDFTAIILLRYLQGAPSA